METAEDATHSPRAIFRPWDATNIFVMADALRRSQASALALLGLGPTEISHRILVSDLGWRLRDYSRPGDGPAVLIVSAPLKRPYIWDLAPSTSAVRVCLAHGMRIFLIEWTPPRDAEEGLGLNECASAIGACVARIASDSDGARPFLMGHSLGGTFAAICAALEPDTLQGLVLLDTPLCFRRRASPFEDALFSIVPDDFTAWQLVPGSLVSELSALASPQEFVWARYIDAALSLTDQRAAQLHAQIERWALDEVPLSGGLVGQILQLLYQHRAVNFREFTPLPEYATSEENTVSHDDDRRRSADRRQGRTQRRAAHAGRSRRAASQRLRRSAPAITSARRRDP
jgi:polyhydroxyalkanoate synthase subunit PhaC